MAELVPHTDLSERLVGCRVKLEGFRMEVHLGVEEVEQRVLEVLDSLVFEVADLGNLCRDLLGHLD